MVKYLFVDSYKRINKETTNPANFETILNDEIEIKKYVKLLNIIIPKSIYLINDTNNKLKITFSDATIKNIIIDIGNYDTDTLALKIKNLVNYSNFNIVLNDNYQYVLTANINFTIEFQSQFYKLIGLHNQIYNSNNNTFTTGNINFNYPINFFIDIQNISTNYITNNENNSFNFVVPMNVERFSVVAYNNYQYEQINYVNNPIRIKNLKINILDIEGNAVDLKSDWSMVLEFF